MSEAAAPAEKKAKKPIYKRVWFWILAVIALAVIATSVGGDEEEGEVSESSDDSGSEEGAETDDSSGDESEASDEEEADEGSEEAEVASLGEPVAVGDWEITVSSVGERTAQVGDEFLSTDAQGEFLPVEVSLTNNGSSAESFFASDFVVIDTDDREFSYSSDASMYSGEAGLSILDEVNPGNTLSGYLYFDVAETADIQKVHIDDGWFSDPIEVNL